LRAGVDGLEAVADRRHRRALALGLAGGQRDDRGVIRLVDLGQGGSAAVLHAHRADLQAHRTVVDVLFTRAGDRRAGQAAGHALHVEQLAPDRVEVGADRELVLDDHREVTFTPRASPRSPLCTSVHTRSHGLWLSDTTASSGPRASWIAEQIACSGAPPPSPMPLAPFGVNGLGDSMSPTLMSGASSVVSAW